MQSTITEFTKILTAEDNPDTFNQAKGLLMGMSLDKLSYSEAMYVINSVRTVMHDAEHLLAKAAMYELTREQRGINTNVLESMRDKNDAKY